MSARLSSANTTKYLCINCRAQCEINGCPAALPFAPGPDSAAIAFHDSPANCESQARTGIVVCVKALEQAENALRILRLETNSIVRDADKPLTIRPLRSDVHPRGQVFPAVLETVGQQVLKD